MILCKILCTELLHCMHGINNNIIVSSCEQPTAVGIKLKIDTILIFTNALPLSVIFMNSYLSWRLEISISVNATNLLNLLCILNIQ